MEPLILIAEDERPIRHFIKVSLETQKYRCLEALDGSNALMLITSHNPDIVILDLGLPDMDGLEVIHAVREWSRVPIIVVSARGHEREKVEALDAGADDYLTKPFSVPELLARIRVTLRRNASVAQTTAPVFELDRLIIDFEKRRVTMGGDIVHLTPTEYNLVVLLAKHCGKVLTHRFLISQVWGSAAAGDAQTLRVCMGNLRRKIEEDTAQPRYIVTEVGVGYRMADE